MLELQALHVYENQQSQYLLFNIRPRTTQTLQDAITSSDKAGSGLAITTARRRRCSATSVEIPLFSTTIHTLMLRIQMMKRCFSSHPLLRRLIRIQPTE
ncbi:hypothetical protein RIF29_08663 [Crotalaria pallida]|uniref:Uncharacterized protein n=1 Tax=Crotalaria pallida TaxID=3830 RepID=A0AAN9FTS2_CROPI